MTQFIEHLLDNEELGKTIIAAIGILGGALLLVAVVAISFLPH